MLVKQVTPVEKATPWLSKIQELELRLGEAEATLDAIRSGAVDALVVNTNEGNRIYTLQGADHVYRVLFEALNEGALTLTAKGIVLYTNSAFARLVGVPLEQILGSSISRYMGPEDWDIWISLIEEGSSKPVKKELRLQHRNGIFIPVMVSLNPVSLGDSTDLATYVAVITDLISLKVAQEELKRANQDLEDRVASRIKELTQAHQRLKMAQKAARSGIWEFDLLTSELYWSEEYYELLGLDRQTCKASWENWIALIYPEDRERTEREIQHAIERADEDFNIEFRRLHPTYGLRWYASIGQTLLNPGGQPTKVVGIILDITKRKRLEEERDQHMAELAYANEAKDFFFNILSHELRTPLAVIRNANEVLKKPEATKGQHLKLQNIIDRNVRFQTRIVDDLLDLSRMMRGKLELKNEPLDLRELAKNQTESIEKEARANSIRLQLSLGDEAIPIYGDPMRLGQIISNLLTNAIKFTNAGGSISVRVGLENNQEACLTVRDTGIGIAPELIPHLFEPFKQADTSLNRKKGGLGIGLTIAHSLAEFHGGSLHAVSAGLGQGSEFIFRLPIYLRKPSLGSEYSRINSTMLRKRVLIVEDNPDLHETMQLLLEMLGHKVITGATGTAALEIAKREHPEIAFIDIGLPDMDGYEVARKLRSVPGLQNIRLVALTGYASQDHRERAMTAGFNDYLVKPLELNDLQRVLESKKKEGR
jgi:PAS domain S-box-containing protein